MLLYAVAAAISAFLLFLVQPIAGRILLPQFGGSAGVWSMCLLFFQAVLLAGYGYSHVLVSGRTRKISPFLHLGVLAASLASLALAAGVPHASGANDPTLAILWRLAVLAGLPFFALSATSPLAQAWYARREKAELPYRLFAFSNAGSLAALAAYPFVIEPLLGLEAQARLWKMLYAGFALLFAAVALRGRNKEPAGNGAGRSQPEAAAPALAQKAIWILLAAAASALLLTVTTLLTKDVAPAPLLWLLPLCLYLLSFILCFAPGPWYNHRVFSRLLTFGLFALAYGLAYSGSGVNLALMAALFCGGLFVCCMFCHGELARLKPPPEHLTVFYLMVSLGGALGGVLVAIAAPHLFPDYYEFPLALAFCAGLGYYAGERNTAALVRLLLTLFLVGYVSHTVFLEGRKTLFSARNFYGPLKVIESGNGRDHMLTLLNGTISHGSQFTEPGRRRQATTYYGPSSGGGLAILHAGEHGRRVGLVGLGPGTLAVYGRRGDYFRFYEINPLVIRAARERFTFLADCEAEVEVAEGDARLLLQQEPSRNFDVLVLDAFSGDSIPVHLLTREAFQVYDRHLKPGGVLAVHVSNRFLDLEPLLGKLAESTGRAAISIVSPGSSGEGTHTATWVLISGDAGRLELPVFRALGKKLVPRRQVRVWTDDYSNLLQAIK